MNNRMYVEGVNIERMLFGMNEICDSMLKTACSDTYEEIIHKKNGVSDADNAMLYVYEYADLMRGVFNLMSGSLGIITDGLANDEIQITVKS